MYLKDSLSWFSFLLMLTSIILGLSVSQIFMLWICLEVNMLSFISFMSFNPHISGDIPAKYFMIQSLGSLGLILTFLLSAHISSENALGSMMIFIFIKLGVPPFHWWFIFMLEELPWESFLMLSVTQKILPLMLLMKFNPTPEIIAVVTLSVVGILGVFTQKNIKKFLAYSSLLSLSWLVAIAPLMELALLYLSIYFSALWLLVKSLNHFVTTTPQTQESSNTLSKRTYTSISLLSLGGMPPLLGFFIKICFLSSLFLSMKFLETLILLVSSPFILFLFLSIILNSWTLSSEKSVVKTHILEENTPTKITILLILFSGTILIYLFKYIYMGIWHLKTWFDSSKF